MDIEIAKEILKRIDIKFFLNGMTEQNNYIVDKADEINIAIDTVLNELEKKDKQIEQYQNMLATNDMLHVLECEKKDKIIDLMAEQLAGLAIFDIEKDEPLILRDKEEIKQYFKEKVEG